MTLNPYSPCPGGCGSKLKFCSMDIFSDLEKIDHMIEGEQLAAALAHANRVAAKHPDRCSVLGMQAVLCARMGQLDDAERPVNAILAKHPNSHIALAMSALLTATRQDPRQAVPILQQALGQPGDDVTQYVVGMIRPVGMSLLLRGYLLAARAHLAKHFQITQDQRSFEQLARIGSEPQIPLLMRDDSLEPWQAPASAPWKTEADRALGDAMIGRWQLAAQRYAALIEPSGNSPTVWWNLALLRAWLADNEGAVEALRKFASVAEAHGLSLDDAVEAEALAQLLDDSSIGESIERLVYDLKVNDADALDQALLSDRRIVITPVEELHSHAEENQPPPRRLGLLLDRTVPASGEGLTVDAVPQVIATLALFGRQTDREARLEIACRRPDWPTVHEALQSIAGAAIGEIEKEEVVAQLSPQSVALTWEWHFPEDTPIETRAKLLTEKRRDVLLNVWPQTPLRGLGGQTPQQAATDPARKVAVLAAILLLQDSPTADESKFDFNELRAKLNLPTAGPVEVDPRRMPPLTRLARLNAEQLSDEQLLTSYQRASFAGMHDATLHLAHEIVRRDSLKSNRERAEAHGYLATTAEDLGIARQHLTSAREIIDALGESNASYDLLELSLALSLGDGMAAMPLIQHIQRRHGQEPGVAERLFTLLYEAGLIDEHGHPAAAPAEAAAAAGPAGPLWTPDAPAAGKSKLWVPGMD